MEIAGGLKEKFTQASEQTIEKITSLQQATFYSNLFDQETEDKIHAQLRNLVPKFVKFSIDSSGDCCEKKKTSLILQNLLNGMKSSSIIDFKIGSVTWGSKYRKMSAQMGFRISGYCFKDQNGEVLQAEGRGFDQSESADLIKIVRKFFIPKEGLSKPPLELKQGIQFCQRALKFFTEINDRYEILSMSAFFARSEDEGKPKLVAKLIDFAHYCSLGEGKANPVNSINDQNVAAGLQSLLRTLEGLRNEWVQN